MIYKARTESVDIQILRFLNNQMDLSNKEKQYYLNLIKGYKGEVLFDSFTEKLKCDCFVLNDLLLQFNNTKFQIDSLLITPDVLYIFEVKNYEGDFYYESDRLYKKPKTEFTNPLIQLGRSESLLRQLLQSLGFTIPIQAFVVFVNPAFTLYQAPLNKPFIFPTQINSFLKNINKISSKLGKTHKALADKLVSLHIHEFSFNQLPKYDFGKLRKGISCAHCGSLSVGVVGMKCVCEECGHEEKVNDAVLRSVEELSLLFPEMKITTNLVHEWCRVVESKKTIRKILVRNYKKMGVNQWTYYE